MRHEKHKEATEMKFVRSFLQVLLILSVVATATLSVIAYWEKIVQMFDYIRNKIDEKRTGYCFCDTSEYDDYADWDE